MHWHYAVCVFIVTCVGGSKVLPVRLIMYCTNRAVWMITNGQYHACSTVGKKAAPKYMATKQPQLKLKLKVQLVCIPLMVGRTFCTSPMTAALPASFSTRPPSQLGISVLKGSIVAIVSPAACSCPIHTDGETSGCCVQ